MAKRNFRRVLDHVLKFEGGYVDHPRDPGGATNLGITHKTLAAWRGEPVTKRDVRELTVDEAAEIYRARYWRVVQGDALPYGLDLVAMDGAVNSGPRRGAKWLQKGVGARADGKVGPKTIEAAQRAPVGSIKRACNARMAFLSGLRHWDAFGRGWSRRVASVEAAGTRMWIEAAEGTRAAREALQSAADKAPKEASDERRAGATQTAATAGGGASGVAVTPDLPVEVAAAGLLLVAGAAILLAFRAHRRARYHEDRAEALAKEVEELKR